MTERILVINPNSNRAVTAAIDRGLSSFKTAIALQIDCITLDEGPPGVETQADADAAAELVVRTVGAGDAETSAYVIACYSDPGVGIARQQTDKPVYGIAESGLATAVALGGNVGVISILEEAVERHWTHARALGFDGHIAADLPVNMTVAQLANEDSTKAALLETGRRLIDDHGSRSLMLGCAGMSRYRDFLQDSLETTVIDPTHAAVSAAIAALRPDIGGGG